jgi:multisubunit Na+/H+ antiporter MnhG subunit
MPLDQAVMILGGIGFALALIALWRLPETFGKPLNYLEK